MATISLDGTTNSKVMRFLSMLCHEQSKLRMESISNSFAPAPNPRTLDVARGQWYWRGCGERRRCHWIGRSM